ncbi:MAG TPA: hypothetical protein VL330_28140 [Actinomycetes bacterium]|nr:hypothetical protein [Actinomycetes bacterium]
MLWPRQVRADEEDASTKGEESDGGFGGVDGLAQTPRLLLVATARLLDALAAQLGHTPGRDRLVTVPERPVDHTIESSLANYLISTDWPASERYSMSAGRGYPSVRGRVRLGALGGWS